MSLMSGAWYLFKTEIKRSPVASILMLGLLIWTLLMSTSSYAEIFNINHAAINSNDDFLADYMFILTFGMTGVMVTFVLGGGLKNDILADRLAYYRSLPISTEHVVLSKIIAGIVATFVLMLLFFIGNIVGFVIFTDFEFQLSQITITYLIHGILLYSLMMITNNLFTWIDLSISYKLYTLITLIFVAVLLIGTILLQVLVESYESLMILAYRFSEQQPLQAILLSIIVFLVSNLVGYKATVKSLNKRNLG